MVLKFDRSMAKVSELKVKKFSDQIPTFAEVAGEKLIGKRPYRRTPSDAEFYVVRNFCNMYLAMQIFEFSGR